MKNEPREPLDAALGKLPRDVTPLRDLWPGIARGVVRTPRSTSRLGAGPWMAFAAAAAALGIIAAVLWVVVHGRAAAPGGRLADSERPSAGVLAAFGEPRDPRYLATRAALEKTFNERLAQLDPGTRAKIQADLGAIRKAREDIRKALVAQPDSPILEQLLQSSLHDEFDLYDDVVRTTQPTLARI